MYYKLVALKEPEPNYKQVVSCSKDVADFLRPQWDGINFQESVFVVGLNQSNKIIGFSCLFKGGASISLIDPKILFPWVLNLPTCTSFVVAHNHPSGQLKFSQADLKICNRLKEGASLLDLKMLDFLVVTEEDYLSAADTLLI